MALKGMDSQNKTEKPPPRERGRKTAAAHMSCKSSAGIPKRTPLPAEHKSEAGSTRLPSTVPSDVIPPIMGRRTHQHGRLTTAVGAVIHDQDQGVVASSDTHRQKDSGLWEITNGLGLGHQRTGDDGKQMRCIHKQSCRKR